MHLSQELLILSTSNECIFFRVKKTEYFENDLKNWKIQVKSGVVFKIRIRCPNNHVVFYTEPKIMNIDRTIKNYR
jgi:hypothetical protein